MYDIFFLQYDEPFATVHFNTLRKKVPTLRRVMGIKGIHQAHIHCSNLSRTSHFFVIDADSAIVNYDFSFKVPTWDKNFVHLWYARNPVNGLVYGWGGVKLFPKSIFEKLNTLSLDMTTSFPLKIIHEIKSITHFNYAPLETWRSAFRETVKLSQLDDEESLIRLHTWRTIADGPFAEFCIAGAIAGNEFGLLNRSNKDKLMLINNYEWLKAEFEAKHDL